MEDVMKQTRLIRLVLIILTMAAPPTWAQVGPVKQQESKDAMTYFGLGLKHLKANQYMEAIEAYKHATTLKPDYAEAYFNLGVVYLATKKKGAALEQHMVLKTLNQQLASEFFNLIYRDKVLSAVPK